MGGRTTSQNLYFLACRERTDTWVPACGGDETPFTVDGVQWLYVWNPGKQMHKYLNLDNGRIFASYDNYTLREEGA